MNDSRRITGNERGSALLVTLMILVGLSLLGLGYVAISETESAISVNERNAIQVKHVAEAGTKLVVEWFQEPDWALAQNLMPRNLTALKTERQSESYVGYYKPDTGNTILFDKPHKPANGNRLFGTEATADIIINATTLAATPTAADQAYLNNLNQNLYSDNIHGGRITEIRVYAPPFIGGTGVNAAGFYEGGTRLGLATIAVTATKCRNETTTPCTSLTPIDEILAQTTVRSVISEWPFPGPSGPIQTNANLNTNGNLRVHWGMITANGELALKRPLGALPWHDAYTSVNFQKGYVNKAAPYTAADNPWPTDPASTNFRVQYDWLHQVVGQSLQDPWYQARTRGDYLDDGVGGPYMADAYTDPNVRLYVPGGGGICNVCRTIWQFQTTNAAPDRTSVLFPKIDYNFWKEVAISSDDQEGIFYLRWVTGQTFADKYGTQKTFVNWTNVPAGAEPGFYFFDTQNSLNPQQGGPGILTPDFKLAGLSGYQAQGFIYVNTAKWDASGAGGGGPDGRYNMPGEPYKDIGYWEVDESTGAWAIDPITGVAPLLTGNDDGMWSWQDLPQTPGGKNDEFDWVVEQRTVTRPATAPVHSSVPSGTVTEYFMKTYYPGCVPGGPDPTTNCSEPHEPFLNLRYPIVPQSEGEVRIGWEAPASAGDKLGVNRRSKLTTTGRPDGTAIPCTATSVPKECTSNSYDRDGGIVQLPPVLNGVLYIEGEFEQTGNMHYFGSVLVQGDASKAGTPDVWFDERLVKGEWPPKDFKFPRVYVSSVQTDR